MAVRAHHGAVRVAGAFWPVTAWALPASYAAAAVAGLGWGLILRTRRPQVYATVGLGAHAVTGQTAPATRTAPS